jgi:hypothetical protein
MTEKIAKPQARYGEGMAKSHCGPVLGWPYGECSHYHVRTAHDGTCSNVTGKIEPRMWCKLWEKGQ